MYRVLEQFHDLEDFTTDKKGERTYFEYNEGDTYPREGYEPAEWRIDELMGGDNPLRNPLIEEVHEVAEVTEATDGADVTEEGEGEE
jgi:hypothetical protein|nr:MAG TPA: hypothetical protein [Caudoviricetes sp.]